jgi:putative transposase
VIEEILMKTRRFSETQILGMLRQLEGGVPVPAVCRETWNEHGVIYE